MKLEELGLSERPSNCIARARITTLDQLLKCTRDDLLSIVNMGHKSVDEIERKLAQHGLALKELADTPPLTRIADALEVHNTLYLAYLTMAFGPQQVETTLDQLGEDDE